MKWFLSSFCAVALSFHASSSLGAKTNAADFSGLGGRFVPSPGLIHSAVPGAAFAKLPPQIKQWARVAQTPLPVSAVAWVVDQCITNPATAAAVKARLEKEPNIVKTGRTTLLQSGNVMLAVAPEAGEIRYYRRDLGGERITEADLRNRRRDSLDTNILKGELMKLARHLGLCPAEWEKDSNGQPRIVFSDRTRYPPPNRKPVLVERSVTLNRSIDGRTLIPNLSTPQPGFHELVLSRTYSGDYKEVRVHWPRLEAAGSVAMPCKSNADLEKLLQKGPVLWDQSNQSNPADAKRITIRDIRLSFFEPMDSSRLIPVLLLDAEAKPPTADDGYIVLILPLHIP